MVMIMGTHHLPELSRMAALERYLVVMVDVAAADAADDARVIRCDCLLWAVGEPTTFRRKGVAVSPFLFAKPIRSLPADRPQTVWKDG